VLVDTSTLLRSLQIRHSQYAVAINAIRVLPSQGVELQIVAQNLIELWVVATRPQDLNGLGMAPDSATDEIARIKSMFVLLPETPAIYGAWEDLVTRYQVRGKPAHDARLVAAMQVHRVSSILTFDTTGFARYSGIEVVHPSEVAAST
jgi:predicted nucleic acid-binding protein